MVDFEVWIRTHDSRLDAAFQLKERVRRLLSKSVRVICTGGADAMYSQRFILGLDAELARGPGCEYILVLEDDILFVDDARDVITTAIRRELPHTWLTLPNRASYEKSLPLSGPFRALRLANHFYYSGAVLSRRELLAQFVFEYMLDHVNHTAPNFDVHFSAFLARSNDGILVLAPGKFGSDPSIPSSISKNANNAHALRSPACISIDPEFPLRRSTPSDLDMHSTQIQNAT